jgi:biopolymer transport protein ExbD
MRAMRRFSDRNAMHTLSELNVTPLLDLAFVLLIIFMITTPLLENSMDLVVPTSATAKTEINPALVQTVSIDRNDVLKLNEQVLTADDLEGRLQQLRLETPGLAVVVRPHKELPVQNFVRVMDLLHKAGITKVGVMTRPEDQGGIHPVP